MKIAINMLTPPYDRVGHPGSLESTGPALTVPGVGAGEEGLRRWSLDGSCNELHYKPSHKRSILLRFEGPFRRISGPTPVPCRSLP